MNTPSPNKNQPGPHLAFVDTLLDRAVLWLVPYSVTPNMVTILRFLLVPVVAALLLTHEYAWGTGIFALAAFTDALDGALARTRHQITLWGKIADPIADKLLIGTTALILVTRYVGIGVAFVLIAIELLLAARAAYRYQRGLTSGANAVGKIKMVFQSVSLLLLFGYILFSEGLLLVFATDGLYISILLAALSLLTPPAI